MTKIALVKNTTSLFFVFIFSANGLFAQNRIITKYYDSLWQNTSKDSAFFYTKFEKKDSFYNCTSYWYRSNRLYGKSTFSDTLFSKLMGQALLYYQNGQLQDSNYHLHGIQNDYHYRPDGKLWAHYYKNEKEKQELTEGFDENGNKIKDFIIFREAVFPSDGISWTGFLAKNLNTNIPGKKGASAGTYTVIIKFIVDKEGKLTDVAAETAVGYGMEEEAIRVIRKSPRWIPAIVYGELTNAYRRQPITYLVIEK